MTDSPPPQSPRPPATSKPDANEVSLIPASRKPRRRRIPTTVVFILSGIALTIILLRMAIGDAEANAFTFLGIGAALAFTSAFAWELVERHHERGGVLAWLGFPVALLSAFVAVPFLAIAVHPPLQEKLLQTDRIDAYRMDRPEGPRLEVWFPRPMKKTGNNLRLGDATVSPAYFSDNPQYFRWLDSQLLSIAVDAVSRDLGLTKILTVSVNADRQVTLSEDDARLFQYAATGENVSRQKVPVRD